MPNADQGDKSHSGILRFAVKALMRHETQIDQLVSKLDAEKGELAAGAEKLNVRIDEVIKKLETLENEIEKLRNIIQPYNQSK
jgi:peptidoglycan hydrolase CwlO-like protein